jgi:hypothetical protein
VSQVAGVKGLDGLAGLVGVMSEAGEVFTVAGESVGRESLFYFQIAKELLGKRCLVFGAHDLVFGSLLLD